MKTQEQIKNEIFLTGENTEFNKDRLLFIIKNNMMNKSINMFKYTGLPETIPEFNFEDILQRIGHCVVTDVNGKLYAISGSGGGKPNVYYYPTDYVIANQYLNFNKTLVIDEDCILCRNTSYFRPTSDIAYIYSYLILEGYISLKADLFNTRIHSLLMASNENVKNAIESFLNDIDTGKVSTILNKDAEMFSETKTLNYTSNAHTNTLSQVIEVIQYCKASFLNEIGLNANYNMKRESINGNEADLNNDGLTPLVYDMYQCRLNQVEKINKKYNTNIKVELNDMWKKNLENASLSLKDIEETTESEEYENPEELEEVEELKDVTITENE